MGRDERRPTVYSAVPKNLSAPYVIPPLEHDRDGRPRPAGAGPSETPPQRRSWTPLIFIGIAALILIPAALGVVAGMTEQSSSGGSAPEDAQPVVETAVPTASAAPAVPPADPAYPALDPAQLAALLHDTAGHEGEQHTAYVEIQVGTETIPESLRDTTGLIGFIGATQPARALQDAANPVALTADPGVLDAVVSGDVLRIAFAVPSAAGRTTVYNGTGIPELRVVTAEKVATLP
ncbi:hypothetical protein LXM50_17355 [Microbacterium sp. Au-Mic1]|uniref:hypothetical protein n=1 Tax=Microbacterium sp. Au-Mic1 TaxID=2906457 RepID=UPI001E65C8F4|nr:hypothetical protein [Microbacterium sp. Au-Mic1]MCE4027747.1 hypothetical protein [Microbacterium sp. Au-Mic1]